MYSLSITPIQSFTLSQTFFLLLPPLYSHFPYCHFFPTIPSPFLLLPSLSLPLQPKNFHLEIPSSYTYRHRYAVESSKERKENRETRSVCPGLSVLSPTIPASKVFPSSSSSRDGKKERGRDFKIRKVFHYGFRSSIVQVVVLQPPFIESGIADVSWAKLDGNPLVENWELLVRDSFFFFT